MSGKGEIYTYLQYFMAFLKYLNTYFAKDIYNSIIINETYKMLGQEKTNEWKVNQTK